MESARDFEKARVKNSEKAGRILRKAKISNPGDYNEAIAMVYEGGNYGKLTQANRYEEKSAAWVRECGGMYSISWKNEKFPRPSGLALGAEVHAANIMGDKMPNIAEGTIELATDSKSSQEADQVDNQPRDKRAGVKTAALNRSFDANIHSQETSHGGHPQLWVEVNKIPGNQPFNDARSLPKQVKTGLNASDSRPSYDARNLPKQVETGLTVRTGLQGVPDSVRQ